MEQHGGRILYTFHFPAVRVWIRAGDVSALASQAGPAISVLGVADPRRFDWQFIASYRQSHPYNAQDESTLVALGSRIDYRLDVINALGGVIPDRSVATLRRDPNVEIVEGVPPFGFCSA